MRFWTSLDSNRYADVSTNTSVTDAPLDFTNESSNVDVSTTDTILDRRS